MTKRPPIGLMPRKIWNKKRIADIEQAIKRYKKAKVTVPLKWMLELIELKKIK